MLHMPKSRIRWIAAAVVTAIGALGASPATAATPVLPDLSIRVPGGPWVGNDVYDSAVGQDELANITEGQTAVFKIRLQSEGTDPDFFTFDGDGNSSHFTVKYFHGQQNVSKAVKRGELVTPFLFPGDTHKLRMEVKAKDDAVAGLGFFVSATGLGGEHDTVLAEVANDGS